MKILGLRKFTLLDYPAKLACSIFVSGCNFNCPYCYNGSLIRGEGEQISEEAVFEFLKTRQGILEGVCISGGEPTLQADIVAFAKRIKELGYLVKVDTNGSNTEAISALIEAKAVDYIAIDFKTAYSRYAELVGCSESDVEAVKRTIELVKASGVDYELRTTIAEGLHKASDFEEMRTVTKGAKRHFIQNYKADCETLSGEKFKSFAVVELRTIKKIFGGKTTVRGILEV